MGVGGEGRGGGGNVYTASRHSQPSCVHSVHTYMHSLNFNFAMYIALVDCKF